MLFSRGDGSVWRQTIKGVRDGVGQFETWSMLDNITHQVGDRVSTLIQGSLKPLCKVFCEIV